MRLATRRLQRGGSRAEVEVSGWTGTEDQLRNFIIRKSSQRIGVSNIRVEGDKMMLAVEHVGQAAALKRLSGIRFRENKIFFNVVGGLTRMEDTQMGGVSSASNVGSQSQGSNTVQILRQFIQSRFDPTTNTLNLGSAQSDPFLLSNGISEGFVPNPRGRSSKIGPVVCKLIGEVCPMVQTLTLQSNVLESTSTFSTLSQFAPNLQNLSLEDNLLQSYNDLAPLNGASFKQLEHVRLIGNPLHKKELNILGGDVRYRANIRSLFPTLRFLDGEELLEEIAFALEGGSASNAPSGAKSREMQMVFAGVKIRSGFVDSADTMATAEGFIRTYFARFDEDRMSLLNLYAPTALFSCCIAETSDANRGGATGGRGRGRDDRGVSNTSGGAPGGVPGFEKWNQWNRNHKVVGEPLQRLNRVFLSNQMVIQAISGLPRTRHPLGDQTSKFLVDALVQGDGTMMIMVHGEFNEVEINYSRSFDRTFIIAPALDGSNSQLAGFPVTILQDYLVVRRRIHSPPWVHSPEPNPIGGGVVAPALNVPTGISNVLPGVPPPSPAAPPQAYPNLPDPQTLERFRVERQVNEMQHALVISFAQKTGLNYGYSLLCLQETGWNEEAAGNAFLQARDRIPPEAYALVI
ncbi:hypothetical protein BJ742DRAFT_789285 [Cladochytrium replicatum]|nr:hypothetical protein BJ742DRAFT_789285 [Cladochytrium replicatum]